MTSKSIVGKKLFTLIVSKLVSFDIINFIFKGIGSED